MWVVSDKRPKKLFLSGICYSWAMSLLHSKKFKIIGWVVGLLLIAFIIWAFLMPLFTNKTVNESLEDISGNEQISPPTSSGDPEPAQPQAEQQNSPKTVNKGDFKGLRGHNASGTASVIASGGKNFVRLENFSVTNGPDLFVAFGNGGSVDEGAILERLKANNGDQNYEIPASIDLSKYSQVFIYCKAFAYPFGVADLTVSGTSQ